MIFGLVIVKLDVYFFDVYVMKDFSKFFFIVFFEGFERGDVRLN